jgi:hypothetical protein
MGEWGQVNERKTEGKRAGEEWEREREGGGRVRTREA